MLDGKTKVSTRKEKFPKAVSLVSLKELFFDEEKAKSLEYGTVEVEYPRRKWAGYKDCSCEVREDFYRLETYTKDILWCTPDTVLMTFEGWKTVEELTKPYYCGKIKLYVVKNNVFLPTTLSTGEKFGYGIGFKLDVDSELPYIANGFLIGK